VTWIQITVDIRTTKFLEKTLKLCFMWLYSAFTLIMVTRETETKTLQWLLLSIFNMDLSRSVIWSTPNTGLIWLMHVCHQISVQQATLCNQMDTWQPCFPEGESDVTTLMYYGFRRIRVLFYQLVFWNLFFKIILF